MFKKGNNLGTGRPKGLQNKITKTRKQIIEGYCDHIEKDLIADIDCLAPIERVKLWLSLQEYLIPKLNKDNIELSNQEPPIINIQVIETDINTPHEINY
jgi:hypothetical protein